MHLPIVSFAVHVLVMVKGSLFIFPVGIFLYYHCISSLTSLFKTSHCIIFPPSCWQSVMLYYSRNLLFVLLSFIFSPIFLITMDLFFFSFISCTLVILYLIFVIMFYYFLCYDSMQSARLQLHFGGFLSISQHWIVYVILGDSIFLRFLLILIF